MSSSPTICASPRYKFPSGDKPEEDINLQGQKLLNLERMPRHKNSNSSEITVCEGDRRPSRTESIASTDTLVNDSISRKNTLNLKLNVLDSADAQNVPYSGSESKAASATEPAFSFQEKSERKDDIKRSRTPPNMKQRIFYGSFSAQGTSPALFNPTRITRTDSAPMINFHECLENIAIEVHRMSIKETEDFILHCNDDTASPMLIIDVRPFAEFIKAHLKGAINICLPSTLLRRPTYDVSKCINSLPIGERDKFTQFLRRCNLENPESKAKILVYDSTGTSLSVVNFCKKLAGSDLLSKSASINVFDETIDTLLSEMPDVFDNGSAPISRAEDESSPAPFPGHIKSKSITLTPTLSNFKLPDVSRMTFKIRHNEQDLSDSSDGPCFQLTNLDPNMKLPQWLQTSLRDPKQLEYDFRDLEDSERDRLNKALSITEKDESVPQISSGVENGFKNRYKDVLLFEHSRVKLMDFQKKQLCDYIHASYINPSHVIKDIRAQALTRQLKYIATQGPLDQTMGDFWKVVVNHKSPLIISLSDEYENGINKCSAFWNPGKYTSNHNEIEVALLEEESDSLIILRMFEVSMDNTIRHRVMQVHVKGWPDQGVVGADDLLKVIVLKINLLNDLPSTSEYPTVIHCSAGCGRTGTLCTIDTLINVLRSNSSNELKYDPISRLVNDFRQQRISMVENLRQYYLIYDLILRYLKDQEKIWDTFTQKTIVKNFKDYWRRSND